MRNYKIQNKLLIFTLFHIAYPAVFDILQTTLILHTNVGGSYVKYEQENQKH